MVYLAILLILCGLLILITALSVETGRVSVSETFTSGGSDSASNADFPPEDADIIFPGDRIAELRDHTEEDIFISFDDETDFQTGADKNTDEASDEEDWIEPGEYRFGDETVPYGRKKADIDSGYETSGRTAPGYKTAPTVQKYGENYAISAVMFDDRSNIIDYESGVGAIDSTLSRYKSIKRIGKGRIESDYDGVNFYLDEKLYRFDFHKVYDIWSGSDYVALPLKGNSTVKLFLIENSPGFPQKVEADFKEYEKGI